MVLFLLRCLFIVVLVTIQISFLAWFLYAAYAIRTYPIQEYGYYIHEFDPWFNYRATEYLAEHGLSKFFKWYDYKSWYPLGRPVGTTIYPGMQITGVAIWKAMQLMPEFSYNVQIPLSTQKGIKRFRDLLRKRGFLWLPSVPEKVSLASIRMSVNDICVTIPAWFGSSAALFGGLLAYEASRSVNSGISAAAVMAVIPANLMRSCAGVFDNEAIAVTAILCTFWLWVRSVRNPSSWPFAIFAAASYIFMVASWGGYIFVLNSIGLHALMLVGLGRFNSGVHKAYTIFFVVGTAGAVQIPVVGWTPLRSLEQIGPLGVFLGYQILAYCDFQRRKSKMEARDFVRFRIRAFAILIIVLLAAAAVLTPMGYFGPLSSRIRGLFVKHTKTGNPLVDSVAEHQPANSRMYASHLNLPLDFVLPGCLVCLLRRNNACYFLALYGYIAMHFSLKMSRLVLICGPITAIMCAIWMGFILDFLLEPFLLLLGKKYPEDHGAVAEASTAAPKAVAAPTTSSKGKPSQQVNKGKDKKKQEQKSRATSEQQWALEEWDEEYRLGGIAQLKRQLKSAMFDSLPDDMYEQFCDRRERFKQSKLTRACVSVGLAFYLLFVSGIGKQIHTFINHADRTARGMSSPTILYPARGPDGKKIIVDDPLKGYEWLAANTAEDARVFAWWDYGYQITGIGKRTSLADGNTWNHEHIATLGRLLSGGQKYSHSVIRHLADYVLIMTGGVNDDLGISTHFARIGNSVFPDHCGDDDPFCQKYTFYGERNSHPSPMMRKSLVYNLYQHGSQGVTADPNLFEEVYNSPNQDLRIFKVLNVSQESKDWVADPKNKICDAPGSWYCVGQYPPAIKKFLTKRKSFSQVEDFNKKGETSAYTKMIEQQKAKGEL